MNIRSKSDLLRKLPEFNLSRSESQKFANQIAFQLRLCREQAGLSEAELATLMDRPLTAIYHWESPEQLAVAFKPLMDIIEFLNLDINVTIEAK